MELDEVAGRITEESLTAGADGRGVRHLDAAGPQLTHHPVQVVDQQGEVLAPARGRLALDEVDLLPAGVQPRALHSQLGPVLPPGQAEHVGVEAHGLVDVGHVDGHVMHGQGSHRASLTPPPPPVQPWPARYCW